MTLEEWIDGYKQGNGFSPEESEAIVEAAKKTIDERDQARSNAAHWNKIAARRKKQRDETLKRLEEIVCVATGG
jgi:L-lactate utilization protein LutB